MVEVQYDYPDVDRGSQLAATYISGCAVSSIFVVMRLCARFSIAGVGIDDICMLVTWIVFLPLTIILSIFCFSGGTRHLAYLSEDPSNAEYLLMLNWIAQPLAIFCLGTGKVAVAFLIIRLLNRASVWRKWSLYISSSWTLINTFLMILFTFVQCKNPAALWDSEVRSRTTCWDPSVQSSFSIYGASFHAVLDIFLALLPITLVWGLKMTLRKRIALCGLLGCGSLTGICAAIKTTKLASLNDRSDFTWETFPLFMWTGIEIILLIVCGSIPALKPLYAICLGKKPMTVRSSQRYVQGTGGSLKPTSRKSYAKHEDVEGTFALAQVSSPGAGQREGTPDDEIGLVGNVKFKKDDGGIHVTRTFQVN
ncbi:hypothetical protein K504DRAFT_127776 [Pleomassaria siparia CBS 279.74]|uniref:Rhodopsin domain-containing protein n=1 Tax=Pleomassaria siparia CBS 279.74 TaxID=1314801 RepID=A0A6G1KJN8_9PLEO|nr:hypothetical protein K504DRAFT_127776 [Pleomassaria siparia CBS 279.74]